MRALKTLSTCNHILVKATKEPEFFKQVCRGIMESHGGAIWAENSSGGGAAFVIRLGAAENS